MVKGTPYSRGKINDVTWNGRSVKCGHTHNNKTGLRYPRSIIKFNKVEEYDLKVEEIA
jgi:hypothetical protein